MSKILLKCNQDLTVLMQGVNTRIEAARKGEAVQPFDLSDLTSLMLCVGDAIFANHRAIRLRIPQTTQQVRNY